MGWFYETVSGLLVKNVLLDFYWSVVQDGNENEVKISTLNRLTHQMDGGFESGQWCRNMTDKFKDNTMLSITRRIVRY